MCDEWMPALRLRLTPEQFHQLPRNAAYRYEYADGEALLGPSSRCFHALLDLRAHTPTIPPQGVTLRPAHLGDFVGLEAVFAASFARAQPFAGLDDAARLTAARACLERTRDGGDGPWIESASFVAERAQDGPVGAAFLTLLPETDPADPTSYYWTETPPADCIAARLGRPHLTWIFVLPMEAGRGSGTALLSASVGALLRLGFHNMATTFLLGNDSSTLWHWRNGFALLPYPWSKRRLRR